MGSLSPDWVRERPGTRERAIEWLEQAALPPPKVVDLTRGT